MKVEKSPAARQKEARIEELEKQLQRTRATLKGLKTRLQKMQARIEEIQKEAINLGGSLYRRFAQIAARLEKLSEKLRKDKRLNREDKVLIRELYEAIVEHMSGSVPDLEEQVNTHAEEEAKAREWAERRDAFREFRVAPDETEQRDIRKLYLQLSKQFHPDRARSEAEKGQFHQLQQQINEAYESNDIHALLDLEAQLGEADAKLAGPRTTDALDQTIKRLERQLELLQLQKARLSTEIKQLRDSQLGQVLTAYDSMEREGYSLEDSDEISGLRMAIQEMEELEAALIDTEKTGKMSPLIIQILNRAADPTGILMQGIADEFGEEFAAALFDAAMFGDDEDEYEDDEIYTSNPNPKFPIGSSVRLGQATEVEYIDMDDEERAFSTAGYTGKVVEALLDDYGAPCYHVELDSPSMKRLPKDFIIAEGETFNWITYIKEADLATSAPEASPEAAKQVYRELFYTYCLSDLPPTQQERLRQILLARPEGGDEENWLDYLEANMPMPVSVMTRGQWSQYRPGGKAEIYAYFGYSPESGLLVMAKIGKKNSQLPLAEFYAPLNSKVGELLNDYYEWFDEVH